jgi:hypothetical protein
LVGMDQFFSLPDGLRHLIDHLLEIIIPHL